MTASCRWRVLGLALCLAACRERAHTEEGEKPGAHAGEKERAHGPGEVHLSAAAVERSKIRVGEAKRQALSGVLQVPAEVRLDPDRTAHVTPIVQSQIAEVRVKLGDQVKKGQPLAVLKSVELGEASASVRSAKAAVSVAEDNLARQRQLLDAGVGAQKNLVEAEGELRKAKAALSAAQARAGIYGGAGGGVVKSPLDGTVIERHATAGEVASPERPLFVVGDVSRVWVVGRVYEKDVGAVRTGMPATARLQAYPERAWSGEIDFVSAVLDEATRSAEVRMTLPNAEGLLKPGLFGSILVAGSDAGAPPVAVPESAVQELEGKTVVFVPADEPNAYAARPVVTGARAEGWVELVSGLAENEKLVVEGAFTLKSAALAAELGEGHAH
ncbi:MAG: efflux RND transporter periplasmic adaptor subunit [Myxococcales bacterium]|nr:efflux RND transporter periplasmic adaptor subunit [Myxococcales bacterium]